MNKEGEVTIDNSVVTIFDGEQKYISQIINHNGKVLYTKENKMSSG